MENCLTEFSQFVNHSRISRHHLHWTWASISAPVPTCLILRYLSCQITRSVKPHTICTRHSVHEIEVGFPYINRNVLHTTNRKLLPFTKASGINYFPTLTTREMTALAYF